MILSQKEIGRIQSQLEEGYIVEVKVKKGSLTIFKRPIITSDIDIAPTLCSEDRPVTLVMNINQGGELIELLRTDIPPGYWIRGIKGAI